MSITVVVPVHNSCTALARLLGSLERNVRAPIILINDASTDAAVGTLLDSFGAARSDVRVVCHERRLGTSASLNEGTALCTGDVLWLSPDTEVPTGFLARMRRASASRPKIATVTALSNSAGAFSIPEPRGGNELPRGFDVEEMQRLLLSLGPPTHPLAPAGNGHCLWVRREAFDAIGMLDVTLATHAEAERDFFARALAAGFVHVVDDGTFIYRAPSAGESCPPALAKWLDGDPLSDLRRRVGIEITARAHAAKITEQETLSRAARRLEIAGQLFFPTKVKRPLARMCFVAHSAGLYGAERSFLQAVTELVRDHALACHVLVPHDGPLVSLLEKAGATVQLVGYSWWCGPTLDRGAFAATAAQSVEEFWRIARALRETFDPDIVYTNTITIPWGALLASMLGKPHVWHIREYGSAEHGLRFPFDFQRVTAFILESSARVIANSDALRSSLFGNRGVTIYNHVPPPQPLGSATPQFSRAGAFRLLMLATLTRGKGQHEALLAARDLARKGISIELVLAGDSPDPAYRAELDELCTDPALADRVRLPGFVEDPAAAILEADALLVCSRSEALSRCALEAMSLGKAVISTDAGGMREVVADGVTGLLYHAGQTAELCAAIASLAGDRDRCAELGRRGRQRAEARFSSAGYGARIAALLREVHEEAEAKSAPFDLRWRNVIFGPPDSGAGRWIGFPEARVERVGSASLNGAGPNTLTESDFPLAISGWAVPSASTGVRVEVVIDGQAYLATSGQQRPDVAAHLRLPADVSDAGFSLSIESLSPGLHALFVRLSWNDGHYDTPAIELNVAGDGGLTDDPALQHAGRRSQGAFLPPIVHACTIVARNYWAQARILSQSFLAHHPGGRFTVLLVDGDEGDRAQSTDELVIMDPRQLGFSESELQTEALIYDVMELATALKPALLRHLLDQDDNEAVLYLDPDIEVFAPLDDLSALAKEHDIVLTPHVLEPIPTDKKTPNEQAILLSGIYNLGFIAVGRGARSFLDYWADRLRRFALSDVAAGMFTDQRFVDFVPAFYRHHIVRDPTLNVAYWNVFQRPLSKGTRGEVLVCGKPLRFYHYSGFDPAEPYLLSKHQLSTLRVSMSDSPVLAELCASYAAKLKAAGHERMRKTPYGFSQLPNGLKPDRRVRRMYWQALMGDGEPPPELPFTPAGAKRLLDWLNAPVNGQPITRYRAHPEYVPAIPPLLDVQVAAKGDEPIRARPAGQVLPGGFNVAGYFRAELGVAQAGRAVVAAVEATGAPFSTLTFGATPSRQQVRFEDKGPRDFPFATNILCINADQTSAFAQHAGASFFDGRYTIGLWFWEVPKMPAPMKAGANHVDEIWVSSPYVRDIMANTFDRPVHVFPMPIAVPAKQTRLRREHFGFPEGYLFLACFDFFSIVDRKNPMSLITAFKNAFPHKTDARLVIKTINGHHCWRELEKLKLAAATAHPNIQVIDAYYSQAEQSASMQLCDAYVSLHRCEGYGLTMAEAMAVAKPVIATGYSGNMAFMTEENSYLVPYRLKNVGEGNEPYPADTYWADPDIDAAAELLRHVHANRAEADTRARAAQQDIRTKHGLDRSAAFIDERARRIGLPPRLRVA